MPAPAGTFPIFPHCHSSDRLPQEHLLFFPITAVVSAPAGALSIFPLPQQWLLPQERYLYFLTAAVVTAPSGALSVFPHCRSSVCSRRSVIYISSLPQQCSLQQEPFPLPAPPLPVTQPPPLSLPPPTTALSLSPSQQPHATIGIPPQLFSSLPQQCLLQQEPSLYFPTAAAVPAPAGTFSIFPHCLSSDCSRRSTICFSHYRSSVRSRRSSLHFFPLPQQCLLPQELSLYFPTAPAVSAPAGALPVFSHCRSSDCSPRSAIYISPLPQQCPLPQEPFPYFPTAAAVSAPAGAPSISPHCRSSIRPRRSPSYIPPLPQQCPLPQELHQYLPTAAAVSTHTSSFPSPRCRSSTLQQKPLLPPRCRSIITSGVQHPISPKPCNFLGGLLATIWLLSHDKHFLGSFWVRAKCRARTPLPGRGEYPGLGSDYRARSPLLGQHAKYAYRLFSSLLCKCELVKWCFINKFREEHARIINTANSSSVITSLIQ